MDILNADLALSNEMEKCKRAKNSKRKNTNATKKKKIEEDEPGYHYIAYVPVNGVVWKLDGLRRQPVNIGISWSDSISIFLANDLTKGSTNKIGYPWLWVTSRSVFYNRRMVLTTVSCLSATVHCAQS
jgi:hypothetical protein